MFIDVGEFKFEVLGHDDWGFYNQVAQEITGDYEFETCRLKPGDAVLDVGAHVGITSIYLARKYGVRCYAYEPDPGNYRSLCMNIGANKAEVIPFNLAVTADGRPCEFIPGSHSGEGGVWCDRNARQHRRGEPFVVESTTVPDILEANQLERVQLLKLDCEGAEHEILAGAKEWKKRVRYLRGELHLNQRLRDAGYSFERTRRQWAPTRSAWQMCEATA